MTNTLEIVKSVENETVFPQANDVTKMLKLMDMLQKPKNIDEIADAFQFRTRQAYMYVNACKYLGFVHFDEGMASLSTTGKELVKTNQEGKELMLTIAMMKQEVVYDSVTIQALRNGDIPSAKEIVRKMKQSNIPGLDSEVTLNRRAETVRAWMKWMKKAGFNFVPNITLSLERTS